MKTFLIFLSRNKAYTFINVIGLSLSLMFVILIGTYTWQEYHVNSQYPKADRIMVYGLNTTHDGVSESYTGGNWRLQQYFRKRYPEIENSCAIYGGYEKDLMVGYIDRSGQRNVYSTLFVDSTFFSMFDIPMVLGNARTALADRGDAVVTDDFARRVYGSPEKAMGKELNMEGAVRFRITGVMPKIEHSSIPSADIFLKYENVNMFNPSLMAEGMNNATGAEVLFLERPGAHLEDKLADMDNYQKQFFWIFQRGDIKNHTLLIPFNKFYFAKLDDTDCLKQGNIKLVNMLLSVGLVILLFSVFNYINLTNAISVKRTREMAMRRLVGASRRDVVVRIIIEAILLCAISMIIAVLLAWAFKPYTEQLLNTSLSLVSSKVDGMLRIILVIVFTIVIGVVAGILPATIISKAKPIDIVRGTFHGYSHQTLSKIFIIVQNTATIVLLAVSFAMSSQIHHMVTMYRGYNTKNVITVPITMGGDDGNKVMDAWFDGLKQLPQVVAATACYGTPYGGGNNETYVYNNKSISSQVLYGDSQYFKVFGLKLLSKTGLKNDKGDQVYVNRQMLAEESLPMNSRYYYLCKSNGNDPHRENISGVLADFPIRMLDSYQHPLRLYILDDNDSLRYKQSETAILIQGDPVTAYKSIQKLFKKLTNMELDIDHPFLEQQIESDYEEEIRMATILHLFAFIAIVISVLGLVAMSTYYIDSRKREIAVRKVFGSTSAEVSRRFIRRFLSYAIIAFVIAIPIIIYFYGGWVSQYSHRAVWWYWIPVAGAIVLAVSYAAVAIQSHHAAKQNPAENIKQD